MTPSKNRPPELKFNLLKLKNDLNIRDQDRDKNKIFDPLRKKWLVLSPEEVVRQLLIRWLIEQGIGGGRISIEKETGKGLRRERYDLLVLDEKGSPWLLAECKSFRTELRQSVFEQSSRYNRQLGVSYQMITNGRSAYLCEIDYEENNYTFLSSFPFPAK